MARNQLSKDARRRLPSSDSQLELNKLLEQAEKGSSGAWISIGWKFQHGSGVPIDKEEAEKCYRKAMALDNVVGDFYLARLYVEDNNYYCAFPLFEAAAESGHLPSIYWLGRCYLRGLGVNQNLSKAEMYLKVAVSMGHLSARRDYSRALIRGTFGRRELLKGFFGLMAIIRPAAKLFAHDPHSILLQ